MPVYCRHVLPIFVDMNIGNISKELKQALLPFYGNNFSRFILFGSYARNDFSDESDLDFLIVLKDPETNPYREIARACPVLDRFLMKYGKVFSLTATSEDKFRNQSSLFFQSVRNEGIEI